MNTTTLTLATADGNATAFRSIGHIKSIAHIPTLTNAMNDVIAKVLAGGMST